MNDEDLEKLAALIEAQPEPEPGWLGRVRDSLKRLRGWLKRALINVLVVAGIFLAGGFGLAWLGVDGHLVIRGLAWASPVMAVGLLIFLRRAGGQNFIAPPLAADLAATTEPADQDDLASDLAREPVQPVTDQASQPTVTATVLPLASTQPTIPIAGIAVAKAGEPVYVPWEDPNGDD